MSATSLALPAVVSPEPSALQHAALCAVVYADVFDYPLLPAEVHRYLHGIAASGDATLTALESSIAPDGPLSCQDGFYTMRGREHLVDVRRVRSVHAEGLWPIAEAYGRLIGELPFVRMVAVTGSLAWDNAKPSGDIDYLVVTEPGRLWLCRLLIAAVKRIAGRSGVKLCVNYVLSERALELVDRDMYTAYELVRMRPIAGWGVYRKMRGLNSWTDALLPNALGSGPESGSGLLPAPSRLARLLVRWSGRVEWLLRSWFGALFEWIEMKYRVQSIRSAVPREDQVETSFNADCFKCHLVAHRRSTLTAFAERMRPTG